MGKGDKKASVVTSERKERMRFRGEKIIKYVQDGFGNAQMGVKTASIDTLYPKTMC